MHVNYLGSRRGSLELLLGALYSPKLFGPTWQLAAGDNARRAKASAALASFFALVAAYVTRCSFRFRPTSSLPA
jgi:hypothetical protein